MLLVTPLNTDMIISDIFQAVMEFSKLRKELERCLGGAGGVSLIRPVYYAFSPFNTSGHLTKNHTLWFKTGCKLKWEETSY